MLKFIKNWLRKRNEDHYAKQLGFKIPSEMAEKQVAHERVGDYCNDCDCHVSECEYWKKRI